MDALAGLAVESPAKRTSRDPPPSHDQGVAAVVFVARAALCVLQSLVLLSPVYAEPLKILHTQDTRWNCSHEVIIRRTAVI